MPYRKTPLVNDEIYHVCNRSIAGFRIFNCKDHYKRMMETIIFYLVANPPCDFSTYKKMKIKTRNEISIAIKSSKKLVDIVAYCIMPTHFHLIIKQLIEGGISKFINLILKSYTRYFNLQHNRKGPLWESRFGSALIEDDNLFMHINRYIHLNPSTAGIANNPKDWVYSSYREYIGEIGKSTRVCNFSEYIDMDIPEYIQFVTDQIGYQRDLAMIKHLTLE